MILYNGVDAAQLLVAFLADAYQFYAAGMVLACVFGFNDMIDRLDNVGVEGAAKSFIGRDGEDDNIFRFSLIEKRHVVFGL